MGMQDVPFKSQPSLTPSPIADLRLAASKLSGPDRRSFEAEMTLKYCAGNPLKAEAGLGWGRQTVALGLAEKRSGRICLGAQSAFRGRKRWEARHPQAAQARRALAEAHAQQAPPCRTLLTSTRLTAQSAVEGLREQGYSAEAFPAPSTMAEVLNRMGYRFRQVVKAKPQKQSKETDALFDKSKKKRQKPSRLKGSDAGAAMGKRRERLAIFHGVAELGVTTKQMSTLWGARRSISLVGL